MTPRRARTPRRRGIAVIAALVAVSVASLLGLSLAARRAAHAASGANLAASSRQRAAAAAGVDIATALLVDPTVLDGADGVLFDGVEIGGVRVRARAVDLETGSPAAMSARAVEVVVDGSRGERSQVARAVGRIPDPDPDFRADLDCSEFAVLVTQRLRVERDAHLGPWPSAPLAALREPVRFGAADGSPSALEVSSGAEMNGCVAVRAGAFTRGKEAADEALAEGACPLPSAIHVPLPPEAPAPAAEAVASLLIDGLLTRDAVTAGNARVPSRASATLRGAVMLDIAGNLHVERGARLVVDGAAVIVVRGNTIIEASSVEVALGGSLAIVALGDTTLDAAYVGALRGDPLEGRNAAGTAAYDGGAERTTIFTNGARRILLTDASVLKGQIYAPEARIDLTTRSAVYGRVLGREVTLHEGVAVYYDPSLDLRRGWTNRASGIWASDSAPHAAVRAVGRLDSASLSAFVATRRTQVESESRAHEAVAFARGIPNANAVLNSPHGSADADGGSSAKLDEATELPDDGSGGFASLGFDNDG
ncbi:MAG: DUF7305 domain-containing protein [Phycisphaerales bacterium]